MAYTVLARRYRSNTFDEVVGQNHIAQTLKKAIQSSRIAHAYLFCGTRGTGKTSTARILAKCLNCQSADHAVTEPCNVCDSCKSIARGDDIDVIEIDAASNTGVDNIRDVIISSAYNSPARSRFKVFIIDEVHMLSKSAFNALLKTLEEPPAHVKFILATTEPEKVLPTILSRCQRYDFRNIPTREIAGHLKSICKTEKIEADEDALLLVAKAGAGSMRDSLSLLDRLLSVGETRLTVDLLEQLLGLPKSQLIFDLVAGVGGGDVQSVLSQTDSIISNGLAVDTLIVSLIDHLRNLMLLRTCGPESQLVEVPGLSLKELTQQADQFDPAALSQDIVILEELRRHVRQSQAGRALLDATMVRMTLADQFSSLSDLLAQLTGGGAGATAQKKKPGEPAQPVRRPAAAQPARVETPAPIAVETPKPQPAVAPPPAAPVPAQSTPSAPQALTTSDLDDDDDLPAPGKVWDGGQESLASLMAKHIAAAAAATPDAPATEDAGTPEPSNIEPVRPADLSEQWRAMLALLVDQGPALGGLLQHGQFIGIEDGVAVVRYAPHHETFVKLLERNGKKDAVRDAISKVMDRAVGVKFEVGEMKAPAATQSKASSSHQAPASPQSNQPPASPPPPARPSETPRRPAPAAPPPVEPSNTIRVTDEIRTNLYKNDSLIRAVVDTLGGSIIRLEETE